MPQRITVGVLTKQFAKTYKLKILSSLIHHEFLHTMTGMDISVADEQRVTIYEMALQNTTGHRQGTLLKNAFYREKMVHDGLVRYLLKKKRLINAKPSGLETDEFRRIQAKTRRLSKEEVREQYFLGQKMAAVIEHLTGKPYYELTKKEAARLDFSLVNFSAEAHAIKRQHETAANRKVATATARMFRNAARRQGAANKFPAAGASWHKRRFKSRPKPQA